jgi:RimJ/RimL family protein N-acetyltransferase
MRLPVIATTRTRLLPFEPPGTDVVAAPGWPHADTATVLRAADELGWPTWLISLGDSEQIIGEVGIKGPPDPAGRVEIGYGLAGPYRGRGYGTEVVRAVLGWLIGRPEVRRVVAEVAEDNLPSRRLLERLDFRLTPGGRSGYISYEFTQMPDQAGHFPSIP